MQLGMDPIGNLGKTFEEAHQESISIINAAGNVCAGREASGVRVCEAWWDQTMRRQPCVPLRVFPFHMMWKS